MHSPNKLVKTNTINYQNDNEDLKLLMNNNNLNSVDSILMHNYPYMLASPQLYNNNNNNYHHQQQQHQMYHQIQQQQYRRVRPEPVNEKSIVGSMVGFFHDVVGTSENHHTKHSQRQQSTSHTHHHGNIVQSGSSTLLSNVTAVTSTPPSEIKEQIEWLHYEHLNMLDSSKSFHKTISNNILLVLGYKTGFSVWNIDVIIIINLFIKKNS